MNVNLSPASVDIAGLAKYFLRDMQMVSASQLDSCFVSFSTASSHTEPPPPPKYIRPTPLPETFCGSVLMSHPLNPLPPCSNMAHHKSTSWDILGMCCHPGFPSYLHPVIMGSGICWKGGAGGWAWQPSWRFLVLWERPLGRENQFGRSWDCTSYMAPLCNGHLGAHMETSWSTDSFKRNYNYFSEKISRNFDICELLYRFYQFLPPNTG